jgi:hypothetical protein
VGEAVSEGQFRTIGEAVAWCGKELAVEVSYKKLYDWFRRWGYRKKVPQPMAEKADVQAQEGWKKGGYWQAYTICNQKPSEWRGVKAAASPTGWPPP